MTRPTDETLLAFLEQRLEPAERNDLLDRLDRDPELALELRRAAIGLEALRSIVGAGVGATEATSSTPGPRISPWWAVAAAAATLVISVPVTLRLASAPAPDPATSTPVPDGAPVAPEPSFVLVLHGVWPDAGSLGPGEGRRRADEYWSWTAELAERGLLLAAGDLRWEPGERLGPEGARLTVGGAVVREADYVVGMIAVRAGDYEEALELARECPHLRYGGSVSVRRVGAGFVTGSGMGDWSD